MPIDPRTPRTARTAGAAARKPLALRSALLAALLLAAAAPAAAISSEADGDPGADVDLVDPADRIDLVWRDTGTSMLFVDPGDPALAERRFVLDVVLTTRGERGIGALDLDFVFDLDGGNELDFVGGRETPGLGEPGLVLAAESPDGNEGLVTDFDVRFPEGIFETTVTLGSVVFTVNPANVRAEGIDVFAQLLGDGSALDAFGRDIAGRIALGGAQVKPLPEPTTAALMVAGLAMLAWSGRRRA